MDKTAQELLKIFELLPDYIGEGIIELLIMIIGGLILGYITSKYLYKINELNKVERWLLEKRIPVYEELFRQTEEIMQVSMILPDDYDKHADILEKYNLHLDNDSREVSSVFLDSDKLTETFLSFDKYASSHRLFLDSEVAQELDVFQNYFALINRMIELFDAQMIMHKIENNEKVKILKSHLTLSLGLYLSSELLEYVERVQNTIRVSMNHLRFTHRKKPDYSYDYYRSENGYIMTQLKNSNAIINRENIRNMITRFIALGLYAGGIMPDEGNG